MVLNGGQSIDPQGEYNAAGYSTTSAARSARVSWRHYSYGVGSAGVSVPHSVGKQPMVKSKSSELQSSPAVGAKEFEEGRSPGDEEEEEEQPYVEIVSSSISKARHSQPPIGDYKILGHGQGEQPKRGLSRTKSQDYLDKKRKSGEEETGPRKPSPQMLEFYK